MCISKLVELPEIIFHILPNLCKVIIAISLNRGKNDVCIPISNYISLLIWSIYLTMQPDDAIWLIMQSDIISINLVVNKERIEVTVLLLISLS